MSETITASLTVSGGDTITVNLNTLARGPAGTGGGGSATWGGITGTLSAQTDLQTALNLKAPLASPALTGTPTAPTAVTTTSTTQVATTAFVQQELASGVTVARNLEFLAHNGSGATIAKGSIVYINGAVEGVPRITKSQANNNTNSARTIGFVKADIADGANGFVIIEGELLNVSTADSSGIIGPGIPLYLSPTTLGAFTRTKPSAPQHIVYVGVVVTASTGVALDGKIIVGIQNGYELNEIHDVSITAPVAAKQVIKRNAGDTLWVNESIISTDVSDSTATGRSLMTATNQSDARTTGLGSGATGDALFTAASVAAAYTALNVSETAGVGPVTASTQNVDTNVGSLISVAAGTYQIEINATFSNATSSSGNFRLSFGSNPFTSNPQRIGPAIVNETASTAFYGDNTGVGFVGATNATTSKCSVWASGVLTFSGSNSIQLRVRNTAATGTVTCDAYRMTVKKLA